MLNNYDCSAGSNKSTVDCIYPPLPISNFHITKLNYDEDNLVSFYPEDPKPTIPLSISSKDIIFMAFSSDALFLSENVEFNENVGTVHKP